MKMSTIRNAVIAACLAVCLAAVLGGALAGLADEAELITVRVGFFAFDGYHEREESGIRSGYGYDMLQHLAGYAGFRYEYAGYDKSWSEMQDMLENGEIDLLTSAQKTEEREARFDFSAGNIGVSSAILTVKAGDSRYMLEDYANWSGIRVGMIGGNSRNGSFAEYASARGFTYSPVYFDSVDEMVAELKSEGDNKSIDAVLTSDLRRIDGEWVLAQFAPSPFYIMVKKGNSALLERVNDALAQLDASEPDIRAKLMNEYYTPTSDDEIAFTPEERAYIQKMSGQKLTALVNPDRAPYSWLEDGEFHGVIYDAALEIAARCGLEIEFIAAPDRAQYWRLVNEGKADLRFDAAYSYNQAEKDGYWLTAPYISAPVARLYRKDATAFKIAAAPANSDIWDNYARTIAENGLIVAYYDSVAEAVEAVMDGKRDVAFLPMDAATMATRSDATNKLVAEEIFGDAFSYSVAVNRERGPLLYSIISKVVSSLDAHAIDVIRQDYAANLEKPFSLVGYFYDYPLHVLVGAVTLLGVAILIIVTRSQYKSRKAELQHLKKEQEQNELLKEALSAAEKAGAAKSQFLSRVSHEMRTPLNAIIGFIELAKGEGREKSENYMVSCDLAAKQLLSVINDVLDMASIESGKLKIASAPFSLNQLISSITNIYGAQCKQKGIEYETKFATPTDDWLIGDELRVNQILMNLLGNSVKFTSRGHICLTVSQTDAEDGRLLIRFAVEDTGCGMSDEMKARLFKPFEQESANTAKKYGGSGLGLSIVKNLASMMGGSIGVESRQDEGTTFTVELPLAKSAAITTAAPKERPRAWNFTGKRVLLVEDNVLNQVVAKAYLSKCNMVVELAENGRVAVDMFTASKPGYYDAILMDIQMPVMDGFEATKAIRESCHPDAGTIQIIAQTADAFKEDIARVLAGGMNEHVSKPIKPDLLSAALHRAFSANSRD